MIRWRNLAHFDMIEQYQDHVLNHVINHLGKKNVLAIILTGSIARNQAKYRTIDGQVFMESDIDVVIVVRNRALLQSLIKIKKLSRILTNYLRKLRLLSEVSLSVVTEKSIRSSTPSIFMFDLVNNGKIIYQNQTSKLELPNFSYQEIPIFDIYRLLFNRMVEALASFVSNSLQNEFEEVKNVSTMHSLEKLYLAMIQSMLIKSGILAFSSETIFQYLEGENHLVQHDVVEISNTLRKLRTKNNSATLSKPELRMLWLEAVKSFREIIEKYGFDEKSPATFNRKLKQVGVIEKVIGCIMIILQYFKISPTRDLVRSISFMARFGPDEIYLRLYILFISSTIFFQPSGALKAEQERWLNSYSSEIKIWKHKTGA